MKKIFALVLCLVMTAAVLTGCGSSEVYTYKFKSADIGIWGGRAIEHTIDEENCTLTFDADGKEITFNIEGNTYNGKLTKQVTKDGVDTWQVEWDTAPVAKEGFPHAVSAFVCGTDYKKPSKFVFVSMYFDSDDDTIKADFSMEMAE